MRNLCGYQYCCSFAGEREDTPLLLDRVPGSVPESLEPFGVLGFPLRPSSGRRQHSCRGDGPYALEFPQAVRVPFFEIERIDLW